MSPQFEQDLANQRIADLRRDASLAGLAREARGRRARGGRLARLRRQLGLGRVSAVARSATETLGLIISPAWPDGRGAAGNPARPSLGR